MLTDYWAYHYDAHPNAAATEAVDEDFDIAAELARITAKAEAGEAAFSDPDDWETIHDD